MDHASKKGALCVQMTGTVIQENVKYIDTS